MLSRKLKKYQSLINNMPVLEQACDSKIKTWREHFKDSTFIQVKKEFCVDDKRIIISRGDLFKLANKGQKFIYSTYIWGFPNGGRGRFSKIIKRIAEIDKYIGNIPLNINEERWIACAKWANSINGLGIATFTKLLYFKRLRVNNYRSLILDSKIISVFKNAIFKDFENLLTIYKNPFRGYPDYLRIMDNISKELYITPDKLEMFLFIFGSSIK